MTRTRGLLTAAAATIPLLLGACAQPGTGLDAGAAPAGSPTLERGSTGYGDDPVIRVEYRGGFVPPDYLAGRLPIVSVYGDGRVITDGPVPLIAPGPALPNLQMQQLAPAVVEELVAAGLAAGVQNGADLGSPGVADIPSTRITVVTEGGTQTVEAIALREAQADDPQLSAQQKDARKKLAGYVDRLTALPTAEGMPAPTAYRPAELAALASPWTDPGDGLAGRPTPWPGPALPGRYLNPNVEIRCVAATGEQKDALWAAAEKANQQTPWVSEGKRYRVMFRPLLPEESGCDALRSAG